jgi:hypothetical protein
MSATLNPMTTRDLWSPLDIFVHLESAGATGERYCSQVGQQRRDRKLQPVLRPSQAAAWRTVLIVARFGMALTRQRVASSNRCKFARGSGSRW